MSDTYARIASQKRTYQQAHLNHACRTFSKWRSLKFKGSVSADDETFRTSLIVTLSRTCCTTWQPRRLLLNQPRKSLLRPFVQFLLFSASFLPKACHLVITTSTRTMSNESSKKNSTSETSLAELAATYWWIPTVVVVTLVLMGGSSSSSSSKSTSSSQASSNAASLVKAVSASIGGGDDGHFLNAVPSALFPRARASQGSLW